MTEVPPRPEPTALDEPLATVRAVARALETAGAEYFVGGSLASSLHGLPRSTQDVDLVADLQLSRVGDFVRLLGGAFYADSERIADGVKRQASFNVIDLRNGFKADVYLPSDDAFGNAQFERRQRVEIEPGLTLPFASPEDVVLQKLRWYRQGGEISERQWLDALGVLKVQGARIDRGYLEQWAITLHLLDLLERAIDEAGLGPSGRSEL